MFIAKDYDLHLEAPAYEPGSEYWNATATFREDLSDVFPYLNAEWKGAIYSPEAKQITWRTGDRAIAIRPYEITISNLPGRDTATIELEKILADINRIWMDRENLIPRETPRKRLVAMEVYQLLLQAYDYLHLFREYGCLLQAGGNDQWGNILAGVDLIRRIEGAQVYALTYPLLTTSSGAKMGKTAAGAVWLDPERVSPYEYYQYWINTEDPDVERFLALFTFLPMEQARELGKLRGAEIRRAKEVLAFEATRILHGEAAAREAQEASRQIFGRGVVTEAIPTTELPLAEFETGIPAPDLFQRVGLCRSRSEARRLIQQGGAYVNDEPLGSVAALIDSARLTDGALVLRAGKKRYHRIVVR